MDWLRDLIKHLEVSRTLVAAIFFTTAVMVLGPIYVPHLIPTVPPPWNAGTFAAMVLTGCLLVLWALQGSWKVALRKLGQASSALTTPPITGEERDVLLGMSSNPMEPLNLGTIDYDRAPFTRLEVQSVMRSLQRKGLVCINEWSSDLVSLTEEGQERALQLQRESRRGNQS